MLHHCKTIILLHVLRYSYQSKYPLFIEISTIFFNNGDILPLINLKKSPKIPKLLFVILLDFIYLL